MEKLNTTKVKKANPTFLWNEGGIKFYEHPTKGDESPALALIDGEFYLSDIWDKGDFENSF